MMSVTTALTKREISLNGIRYRQAEHPGAAETNQDLSALEGHRLRSHGALAESKVPFIADRTVTEEYITKAESWGIEKFEIFDSVLNGMVLK